MKRKLVVVLLWLIVPLGLSAQKQPVWLDTDTGNEMHDLYVIVRIVKDTSVQLIGLNL